MGFRNGGGDGLLILNHTTNPQNLIDVDVVVDDHHRGAIPEFSAFHPDNSGAHEKQHTIVNEEQILESEEEEEEKEEAPKTKINPQTTFLLHTTTMIPPNSQLPKPEPPPGVKDSPSPDSAESHVPAIGKFFRQKSNRLSAVITKHLSSSNEFHDGDGFSVKDNNNNITEFNLKGLKVIVKLKSAESPPHAAELKGRISFFSRSNCRDCTAVRSFLRERNLKYVEINIDVFPARRKELEDRTGSSVVPQIFFNDKLIGGLVALNSFRNSGLLNERMKDLLGKKCPEDAPAPPVYGFDDPEEEAEDEMVTAVRVLRKRVPVQDRLMKMKIVKNCCSGEEMIVILMRHFDCGRDKAVEIGKQLAGKHFIHHVFGENEFEDGNHFYRFLEHEPFITRCFNFRGSTSDFEPKAATVISVKLTKIMFAILESYASEDRSIIDYLGISNSEEFRRYVNLVQDLQRINILTLSPDEKLAFFLNLYNAMVIHAVIRVGHPGSDIIDRRSFNSDFLYVIGGLPYSLTSIKNGILRNNRRAPYSLVKPYGAGDRRLELASPKVNPLIHFGLCNATRSSPPVRFFTPEGIEAQLRVAAREFLNKTGIEVDLAKRTVYMTRIFSWFQVDFGQEKEILNWIINFLDATKAGLLTHLMSDGGPINIVYLNYDWSPNSVEELQ